MMKAVQFSLIMLTVLCGVLILLYMQIVKWIYLAIVMTFLKSNLQVAKSVSFLEITLFGKL